MIRRGRIAGCVLAAVAASVIAAPAPAYVPSTLDFLAGAPVVAHWDASSFPITTWVTPGLTTDITDGSDRVALDRAMAAWSGVADSGAAIFVEREQQVQANVFDGINAIEFSNSGALDGAGFVTLTFLLIAADGTIEEADMLVNDRVFGFTTSAGGSVGLDLETAMLRELGRMLGLTSSPLGGLDGDRTVLEESAVMYSVSRGVGESARSLRPDDVAGIVAMYPVAGTTRGSISGRVTRNGSAVFGAHVVAHDPVQDILVGAVTLPDGTYRIDGLPAGRYLLEALPLTAPAGPGTLGGIFLRDDVDTSFQPSFFAVTVRLGAGQSARGVSVEVG